MASEHNRAASTFVEPLPARPNLEMQHKRAKEANEGVADDVVVCRCRCMRRRLRDVRQLSRLHRSQSGQYNLQMDA
jgi:hypothetical protein